MALTAREMFEKEKAKAGAVTGLSNVEKAIRESSSSGSSSKKTSSSSSSSRSEPLSSYAQEVKDLMLSGKSYDQAISEASQGREVTRVDEQGVPYYGERNTVDPDLAYQQQLLQQQQLQQQLIDAQKEAQLQALKGAKNAQIAGLKGAREGSLAALERQRGEVTPAYQQQRTGLRVQEQQLGRQTAEQAAARGLGRSGSLQQEDLARRLALQQGLTESKQAETGALEDIAASEADVRRQYETGVAQAEAGMAGQAASLEAQAQTAAIQQQLANIQAERQAQAQAQQLQQEQAFSLQTMQQKAAIDEQLARIDAELEQSLQSGKLADSIALEQEKARLRDESTRLAASLRSTGGGGSSTTGLSTTKLISGVEDYVNRVVPLDALGNRDMTAQQSAIRDYLNQLRASGVDDSVITQLVQYYGLQPTSTQTTTQPTTLQGLIQQQSNLPTGYGLSQFWTK